MRKDFAFANNMLVPTTEGDSPVTIYSSPDLDERRCLVEENHIDEHTLSSALDPDELPRLEIEPDHAAFILKQPENYSGTEQFNFKVISVGAFLFSNRLLIVTKEGTAVFDGGRPVRAQSPSDTLLQLLYRSIGHFREHLRIFSTISDEMQDKINTSMENKSLINLFTLEKSMVYYLYAITGNGMLMERVKANAAKLKLTAEQIEILDDILIENSQCMKQAEIYSSILAGLMDARASIVGNNLNALMKTLNIITIGIMVPTFVVSLFSMNVKMPFQQDHLAAFWLIFGLAVISVATFLLLWRVKWR